MTAYQRAQEQLQATPARFLVTGAAGFIGSNLVERLLQLGQTVVGIDNFATGHPHNLADVRNAVGGELWEQFRFIEGDLRDLATCREACAGIDLVLHQAALGSVPRSIADPIATNGSNVDGFLNVLVAARDAEVRRFVFATSSSVYGANARQPFSERDNVDHPLSLYAATKKANELMAHTYAHLFGVASTGLRFFTVYGPWGRPDMALFRFTRGILAGEPIPVYNAGKMIRDFTYIDDIAEGVVRLVGHVASPDPEWDPDRPDPARSRAPYRIYNIGNNRPVELLEYIHTLEEALGRKARMDLLPMQPGDVPSTMADVTELEAAVGFRPATSVRDGIAAFVRWYRMYYNVP